MDVKFNPIDLQTWPHGQMFYYFSKMAPTGYSLTVDLDVTMMKAALKNRKIKFFPAYLWLTTKMLNRQVEFKVAMVDSVLGYWDVLTPLYATFHEDDKTISLMWTEYDDTFSFFYDSYLENQQQYSNHHGLLSQSDRLPPANSYTVSSLPWVGFKHFAFHSYENKPYYFPTIEAGKFIENNEKIMMPLSITVHHATTDGWHIKTFLADLQHDMNHPEIWIDESATI
ncbi:CatA-like O-acetyltransferase [Petroclostridium sp. X23]|uniref:CatA-like O-acetyltransferase n=1 Tax=Petroclostridium sp. X23 TaxID=3045146 RepID=UPI0024AD1335|nr:CatA-like O-acetyltransferase [Petroclostridium sp. X23]WHH58604.1 CatA-like O-acetyltransferase [Petroclostridium sp. X23]